jgi:hypothetical protein
MKKIRLSFFLPLIALAVFPNIGKTIDDIRRAFLRNPAEKLQHMREWNLPFAGESLALPSEVTAALYLLRKYKLPEYAYLGEWKNRNGVEQRLLESAYPAKPQAAAKKQLWLAQPVNANCTLIETREEVQLVDCR